MWNKRKIIIGAFVVLFIAIISHVYAIKNSFVIDDYNLIVNNESIFDSGNITSLISPKSFLEPALIKGQARPLTVISLILNHKVFGKTPFGYHIVNLVLFGLNAVLVYFVIIMLANKYKYCGIALIASIIFAIHPIQTEVVSVVSYRADILAVNFYLISFVFMLLARKNIEIEKKVFLYVAAFVCFCLSLLSKEIAVTFPLAVSAYLVLMGDEVGDQNANLCKIVIAKKNPLLILYKRMKERDGGEYEKRKTIVFKYNKNILNYIVVAMFVVTSGVFLLVFWANRFDYSLLRAIYPNIVNGVTPFESPSVYINNILLTFLHYVCKFVCPASLSPDYELSVPLSLLNIKTLVSLAILIIGAALFIRARNSLLRFAMAFSILTYLPVSNLIPMVNTVGDRYAYLPMVGISILVAMLIMSINNKIVLIKVPLRHWVIVALFTFYGTKTILGSINYKDMITAYSTAVQYAPHNVRVRYNLGLAYMANYKWEDAVREFECAEQLNPIYKRDVIWHSIAVCKEKLGKDKEAGNYYAKALLVNPNNDVINDYANLLWKNGNIEGSIWLLKKSVEMTPDAYSYNNLGTIYAKQRNLEIAIEYYKKATLLKPDYVDAWFNLLNAYEDSGNQRMADETLAKMALMIKRGNSFDSNKTIIRN